MPKRKSTSSKKTTTPSKKTTGKRGRKSQKKEGEEQTTSEIHILERGLIYFFYRPKVELHHEVHSLKDVQKLEILLWPEAPTMIDHKEKGNAKMRLIGISKKHLPSPRTHQVNFAIVEMTTNSVDDIKRDLGPREYLTPKTHQTHELEGARPLGEGVYALVKHKEDCSHLVYVLEQPQELGIVQKAFGIKKEESMIMNIKNPHFMEGKHPTYPKHIQDFFKGIRVKEKKFTHLEPEMLDYEGTQILLIGTSDNFVEEFGGGEEIEELAYEDMIAHNNKSSQNRLFEELHLKRKENPPQPLITGIWK